MPADTIAVIPPVPDDTVEAHADLYADYAICHDLLQPVQRQAASEARLLSAGAGAEREHAACVTPL